MRLGQPYSYELRVTNLTDLMLGDVTVFERSPSEAASQPADGAATHPAEEAGQKYVVGELGPRQTRTITVNGTAGKQGIVGICTSVTYRPSLCSSTEVINPSLQLVKTGPAESLLCEEIVYRYVVSNTGTGTAREVRIEDNLPPGLALAEGGQRVQLNVGPLAEGKSREYAVKLRRRLTGQIRLQGDRPQRLRPGAQRRSGDAGQERQARGGDARAGGGVRQQGADLSHHREEHRRRRGPRRHSRPEGGRQLGNPRLHRRRRGARGAAGQGDHPQAAGHARAGPVDARRPGRPRRFGGETRLNATARNDCLEPVTAVAKTNILTVSGLLLEVYDLEDPIRVGDETVYRVEVKNQGSGPDQNIQIVATLPESQSFVKSSGPTNSTVDGKKVTFAPMPILKPGETVRWEIRVKATAADDARFQIDLTSQTLTKPVTENEATRIY